MPVTQRFSGQKIREARHSAGLTQAALAHAVNTRERNIIRWENDQHAPRFEHVAAIAEATGKDIGFFVAQPEDEDDDEESHAVTFEEAMQALYALARERRVNATARPLTLSGQRGQAVYERGA